MEIDVSKIRRNNQGFINCISLQDPIEGLFSYVVYVIPEIGSEWHSMVESIRGHFETEGIGVYELYEDRLLLQCAESFHANIILPLYLSETSNFCYLTANIPYPDMIEGTIYSLLADAATIEDEVSYLAFVNLVEKEPDLAMKQWISMTREKERVSRGKYSKLPSDYAFLGKGYAMKSESLVNKYSDRMNYIGKFQKTIEGLKNKYDSFKEDYKGICDSLTVSEKNELILELAKRISSQDQLSEALNTVVNKGENSSLYVKVRRKYNIGQIEIDHRRRQGAWRTYLVNNITGEERWLDFEPAAHVIYLMNLIYRSNHEPDKVIDLSSHTNKEAFKSIFSLTYNGNAEEQLSRLIKPMPKGGGGYLRKRTTDSYKIIANCVNEKCSEMGELPSPYIPTLDSPITIDSKLIEIPDEFRAIKVI